MTELLESAGDLFQEKFINSARAPKALGPVEPIRGSQASNSTYVSCKGNILLVPHTCNSPQSK